MSADHRKPVVAFVVLALAAAVIVGVQQAEARGGHLLAAAIGAGGHVRGTVPLATQPLERGEYARLAGLGPAFGSLHEAVGNAVVAVAPLDRVIATPQPTRPVVGGAPVTEVLVRTDQDRRTANGSAGAPTNGPRAAEATAPSPGRDRGPGEATSKKPRPERSTPAPARRATEPRDPRAGTPSGPAAAPAWTGERGRSGKARVHRGGAAGRGKGIAARPFHGPARSGPATARGHR